MTKFKVWYESNEGPICSFTFKSNHKLQRNRNYDFGCGWPIIQDALDAADRIKQRENSTMSILGFGGYSALRRIMNVETGYTIDFCR